jgi:Tol biopolymer transport system component
MKVTCIIPQWFTVILFTLFVSENTFGQVNDHDVKTILSMVTSDSLEFNSTFSPDGKSFYFTRSIKKRTIIFIMRKHNGVWCSPEPISFTTSAFCDADPTFSPSGELYFISNRMSHTNDSLLDYNFWKVRLTSENQWSEPVEVKELNSEKDKFYISFTSRGDAYFSSAREGGWGEEDIYYAIYNNHTFSTPINLGPRINSAEADYDPFILPDGEALIFTSSGRKDSFGKADLYWSVKTKHGWSDAVHFEKNINTITRDFCPSFTTGLPYFFYSSQGNIRTVDIKYLPEKLQHKLSRRN